jgi:exonuclease SbcC
LKIKSITLNNFKNYYGKHTFAFDKATLLAGVNGTGKSTIIEGLMFAIWGYTPKGKIEDLPTRNRSKSCTTGAIIEHNGHVYEISRSYPLKIGIKRDNIALNLSTAEANKYLIEVFGPRDFFTKFVLFDVTNAETNFLEQGQVALKKIIFAGTDERFNKTREKITEIRYVRESLNADNTVLYKHYPSEKRYEILSTNLVDISNSLVVAKDSIEQLEVIIHTSVREKTEAEQRIVYLRKQIENVDSMTTSFDRELREIENRMSVVADAKKNLELDLAEIKKQKAGAVLGKECYACKRKLELKSAEEVQKELDTALEAGQVRLTNYITEHLYCKNKLPEIAKNIATAKAEKIKLYTEEITTLEQQLIENAEEGKHEADILSSEKEHLNLLLGKEKKIIDRKSVV